MTREQTDMCLICISLMIIGVELLIIIFLGP